MKLNSFIEGLQILKHYYKDADSYHIGAEHDQFYAYKTDSPMSPDDVAKMFALGWFQPIDGDGSPYDPEESWSAFT